jgi:hypothetical protein
MGLDIDRTDFEAHEYDLYSDRLLENVAALRELLQRPDFGVGEASIGAEIEFSLVNGRGRPLPLNRSVLASSLEAPVQLELNRFNLEYNTRPVLLEGRPFSRLGSEMDTAFAAIDRAAAEHGGRIVLIGILPTLRRADLQSNALTDLNRFRALSAGVRRLRQAPFEVSIDGAEPLRTRCDDVTLEGANTSFQVHLRVSPGEFARVYNAAQIAIAPVLAACTNSPFFLEHQLWEETRLALFRQAIDERSEDVVWRPGRVSFGNGWVREGIAELFVESIALHPPLLPIVSTEDSLARVRDGGAPQLTELRLHNGTVWRWNRPIYDPADGGHLRIEMRGLPSGPSLTDMIANAAILVGLTRGLANRTEWMVPALPFAFAHDNFYEAARQGLDAMLFWPRERAPSPRLVRAKDLWPQLLPIAREGLRRADVDEDEIDRLATLFASRVQCGITGARWQRAALRHLEKRMSRRRALTALLHRYLACAETNSPVHCWPAAG